MDQRRRATRLAANALWMTLYGAGASSVIWWQGWAGWLGAAVWGLITFALGVSGVMQLVSIRNFSGTSGPARGFDRVLARKIGAVIGIYAVAEGVSAVTLHAFRQDALIFPIAVAIAGAHFWVFARVLGTWEYYVTGILDCLIVAITLIATNPRSMVGSMSSWIFYPLLGCGAALLITAGLMLLESRSALKRLGHAEGAPAQQGRGCRLRRVPIPIQERRCRPPREIRRP